MQELLRAVLAEKAAPFIEPWPFILKSTPVHDLKVFVPKDKLPHKNSGPVVFIGDSCHPMVPYSGMSHPRGCRIVNIPVLSDDVRVLANDARIADPPQQCAALRVISTHCSNILDCLT